MRILLTISLILAPAAWTGPAAAQEADPAEPEFSVRIWFDRGDEPVLDRGDRVRVYYRASRDGYVAVFHIDTDGLIRLLWPPDPDDVYSVRAGRDYRLLVGDAAYWRVDEDEGKGYFFIVASEDPLDFSRFGYAPHDKAWDLGAVGRTVYDDPYLAMDDYVAALIPDWETRPYALDFISYDVGATHDYPRFLCYQCHGFRSYASWNPYTYACTSFRVVIYDDPYFLPVYRYGPTRVVYGAPPRGRVRFRFEERAAGEPWTPIVRTVQPPLTGPTYVEPERARGGGASSTARRREADPSGAPSALSRSRRPSDGVTAKEDPRVSPAPPRSRRTPAISSGGRAATERGRPTLQRRPAASDRPDAGARPSVRGGVSPRVRVPTRPSSAAGSAGRPSAAAGGAGRPDRVRRTSPSATSRPSVRPPRVTSPSPSRGGAKVTIPGRPSARPSPGSARPPSSRARPSLRTKTPAARRAPPKRPSVRSGPSVKSRPARPPARRPVVRTRKPKKPGGG